MESDWVARSRGGEMRKIALIVVISLFAIPLHHHSRVNAQTSKAPSSVEQNPATNGGNAAASETGTQTMKQEAAPARITEYTLPPERDKKARALSAVHLRMLVVNLIYGLVVLLVVLRLKLAPKFRDIAEKVSSKRVLQALIFAPLDYAGNRHFVAPDGDLWKLDRARLWAFDTRMGVVVLGLDKGRVPIGDTEFCGGVDLVQRDPEIAETVVVLFLVGCPSLDCRVDFHATSGCRSDVSQI